MAFFNQEPVASQGKQLQCACVNNVGESELCRVDARSETCWRVLLANASAVYVPPLLYP